MSKEVPAISLDDYLYDLPDDRIARYAIEPRDSSKLLIYQNGEIRSSQFSNLATHLPPHSFLVFNNTKVIPARLHFQKETGAHIEIFLLQPHAPSTVISTVMEAETSCQWNCMIGNKKKWKGETLVHTFQRDEETIEITAKLLDTETNLVEFTWKASKPVRFAELVQLFGEIPLPPYLGREAEEGDVVSYQTVYSKHDGAVAAPTAGLHFTEGVFDDLANKKIPTGFLTLHVGAGTFQPIKALNVIEHKMHNEQMVFSLSFIEQLLQNLACVVPVGTTSMRSLESLYWYGVLLHRHFAQEQIDSAIPSFFIEKLVAFDSSLVTISAEESIRTIVKYMREYQVQTLVGHTEIFIFPGYQFAICKGIITNFHQPGSTLILLIAAAIGEDWKKVYDYALQNEYRFLSFGDSSLLWIQNQDA